MNGNSINLEDIVFHALFIGSTGAGKTNALLYRLLKLFSNRKDVALVLIDPHGDAAFDLLRLIPQSERERVAILDPNFGEVETFRLSDCNLQEGDLRRPCCLWLTRTEPRLNCWDRAGKRRYQTDSMMASHHFR